MATGLQPAVLADASESARPPVLLDVRQPLDYTNGHLPSATLVPRRVLEFRLPNLLPCQATPLVVCDQRGDRAADDAAWLEFLGYDDVRYLDGGVDAWQHAGHAVVEATNGVPSTALHVEGKRFGERVLADEDLPLLAPDELHRRLADDDLLVVDVRTPPEYRESAIPGAVNAEGVELSEAVTRLRESETVVINCAGRTRSIIGTATLRKLGFPDVYWLENGTMGWTLAGYDLEPGVDEAVGPNDEPPASLQTAADLLIDEVAVERLSPAAVAELLETTDVNVYPVDVRTREEYVAGHVPGTISIPGGQAVQRANHYVPDRHGRVLFISEHIVRAAVTAYWFSERGFPNIAVLHGGVNAWANDGRPLRGGRDRRPPLGVERASATAEYVAPETLDERRTAPTVRVVDVDASSSYLREHVPGAEWVPRYHLDGELGGDVDGVVLTCRNGIFSTLAAAALAHRGGVSPTVLRGGLKAWTAAGLPTESGGSDLSWDLRDAVPAPWDLGEEAVHTYLSWETELLEEGE